MNFAVAALLWLAVYMVALGSNISSAGSLYVGLVAALHYPGFLEAIFPLSMLLAVLSYVIVLTLVVMSQRIVPGRDLVPDGFRNWLYCGHQFWYWPQMALCAVFLVIALVSALLTPFPAHGAVALAICLAGLWGAGRFEGVDVQTLPAEGVGDTKAVGRGFARSSSAPITSRGLCWDVILNPSVQSMNVSSGKGNGAFSAELKELRPGTDYFIRAWIRVAGQAGVLYGEGMKFSTLVRITMGDVRDISQNTAIVTFEVETGTASLKEVGCCYAMTEKPTVAGDKKVAGTLVNGKYRVVLRDLQPATVHHVRAFAVNEGGVAYGEERSFTTLPTAEPKSVEG